MLEPVHGLHLDRSLIDDPSVVMLVSSTAEPAESPMPGAAGTQIFDFDALQAGSAKVSLSYDQPFEGGEKGAWTLDLMVGVGGPVVTPVAVSIDCEAFETTPEQATAADLAVGADLVVALCSNASTGYTWSDPQVGDSSIVTLVGSTSEPPASPIPGAPGTQSFTFRGGSAGTTTISFSYDQPWNGGTKGAWTLVIDVVVA